MSDPISRQAVIDAIHNYWGTMIVAMPTETTEHGIAYDTKQLNEILEHNKKLVGLIKAIPSAADPIRRGRWVPSPIDPVTNLRHCLCCDGLGYENMNFCPWCGANMTGLGVIVPSEKFTEGSVRIFEAEKMMKE